MRDTLLCLAWGLAGAAIAGTIFVLFLIGATGIALIAHLGRVVLAYFGWHV